MEQREIKFRGISEESKQMVFGCLVNNMWTYSELTERQGQKVCEIITGEYSGDCWEEVAFEDECIVTVIPETVGEFTRLKDKNGNEIYEGDIVKFHDHPTGVEDGIGKIYWKDGKWMVTWSMIPLGDYGTAWTEVVGNIYQNPELLTQTQK